MAILRDSDTGRLIEVDSTLPFEYFRMIDASTVPPTLHFNLPPAFRPLQEGEEAKDRFALIPSRDGGILSMAARVRAYAKELEPLPATNGSEKQ